MNFSDGFFNIFLTSSSTNCSPSRLTIGWEWIFDWKGFECNEICYSFTMSKTLVSCVIFIHAHRKRFNLLVNGTSGIFFDKNNLFINGWTFLDSHLIGFSGFKSMLKKVWVVILTIALLLTPCLSVVGMTLLLLLLNYHYGIFLILFLWEKTFCPLHFLSACERLNEKSFLSSLWFVSWI